MASIYVSSTEAYSGKTAVCLGLVLNLRERGLKAGYMKPVGNALVEEDGRLVDDDVIHAQAALHLKESLDDLCPVLLTEKLVHDAFAGEKTQLKTRIKKAYGRVKKDNDTVVLEGVGDLMGGLLFGLSDPQVASLTDSRILLITHYDPKHAVDRILTNKKLIGDGSLLAGVAFVDVPGDQMDRVRDFITPFLERENIRVFGALLEDQVIKSMTIEEITERLNADVLVPGSGLVGSLVVGAMSPCHALKYLRWLNDKAVITGGDRTDILLAALETPTRCLIPTGNLKPDPNVLAKAREKGVAVLLVSQDTMSTVHVLEGLINRIRATDDVKLARVRDLIKQNFDLDAMVEAFGV